MLHILLGVLAVAGAFGFLIIIHELGHWVAARRFGVRCPSFGIGVGPKLGGFRWRGTEFELRPIPFIGYVLMTGEDSSLELEEWRSALHRFLGEAPFPSRPSELLTWLEAHRETLLNEADDSVRARFLELKEHLTYHPDTVLKGIDDCEGNINLKPTLQRLIILLGGIAMNLVAALIIFIGLGLTHGIGIIDQERNTSIDAVSPGSAAARAGLAAGETVTAVDGEPVLSGGAMIAAIGRHPGQPMKLEVKTRKGAVRQLDIVPDVALGNYVFTYADGKVRYLYSITSVNPTGVQPNQVVESLNEQPVSALAELAKVSGKKVEVRLEGRAEPLVIEDPDLKAVGKIGIVPGSILIIRFQDRTTSKVVAVDAGGAAEQAGIKPGDTLVEVGGSPIFGLVDLQLALAHWDGKTIPVSVVRDGKLEKFELATWGATGLTLEPVTPLLVVKSSFRYVWNLAVGPAGLVLDLVLQKKAIGSVSKEVSGPVQIMQMLYSVSSDLAKFLFFLALLNGAIAGTNLVPIPALDGARCLVVLFGALRGRDVDPEKENRVHAVGLIVLLGLMALKSITEFQNILSGSSMIK